MQIDFNDVEELEGKEHENIIKIQDIQGPVQDEPKQNADQ
jgi:hypothetical protein